ncbi:Putative protein in type-1 retrotransposable element R1DM [Araneus ventricosus]|uniref:Reverse transcriptase domain-containing protein n=1 Tax=Araneus ventricosus TaxID=182803 RepID=A0A4Y2MQB5_ARAVE|nr:Putative protein in type-1 retrotransposable element R1DM [Araneus ventricosus]
MHGHTTLRQNVGPTRKGWLLFSDKNCPDNDIGLSDTTESAGGKAHSVYLYILSAPMSDSDNRVRFIGIVSVGNIILFHKHGKSKTEASSYRPISLLPTICKVLEKLLTQRLNFHLEKNNRLSNLQYGFREGKSTEMAITKLLDTIHKGKSRGDHVLVLSIDIKGAFDNIQHNAIVSYLDNSKCPENIVNIFKNLLQNRKVILNTSEEPAIRDQKQGCTQGSCSEPALWNLVANEIL